jgi:hypothetical protein
MDLHPSRRRFLRGVGLSGAALTLGGVVLPIDRLLAAAGAQEAEPTAPELAAFAETIELAGASLYGAMRGRLSRPQAVSAITAFQKHHQDHANTIGPAAADKRVSKPNQLLLPTLTDQLNRAQGENGVLRVAYDFENGVAATYLYIVDAIDDEGLHKTAASILPIEAQHAVVLGTLIGETPKDVTAPDAEQRGFESADRRLDPAQFPTVVTTSTSAAS